MKKNEFDGSNYLLVFFCSFIISRIGGPPLTVGSDKVNKSKIFPTFHFGGLKTGGGFERS